MPANRFNGFTDYGIGIGLRVPHYNHILERKPVVDWFEIISENYMIDGGRPLAILDRILEQYRVVQHGVSMYFGSAEKLNREHLKRLKALVKRTKTPWLTDHLCWGSVDGKYSHDLLPMPYTFEAAKLTARNVREARDFLEIPIAVENVSSYAEFHVSEMTEWEFLNEVVERADCGILLDVNNIYVSSKNHSFDPYEYLNSVPADRVAQIHLAGHSKFTKYILDTHDHPVIDPVWKLYDHAIKLAGPTATLLEWDDRIPSFEEVHAHALKAEKYLPRRGHAMKLLELQREMAAAIMQPLTRSDEISSKAKAGFIRPNDRLTSRERLEIYSKSYWYRLIDGIYDDFPGLRAVVGQRACDRLIRAYLADCPSRSFTMRDLGSQLHTWLGRNPKFAGKKQALARDMVALEWAHIEAWDGPSKRVLGPEDLVELGPHLKIGLQPYIQLLELKYPVDDLRVRVNTAEHEVASNAPTKLKARRMIAGAHLKPKQIHVAVHRYDYDVYYRRLVPEEFRLLKALRDGRNLGKALDACCRGSKTPIEELQANLQSWFATSG